ncbi:MAG: phage protease, partial [Pseudomonadota bacterium]
MPAVQRFFFLSPFALHLAEAENGKRTSDIQIAKVGEWEHPWYGDFSITDQDFDDMIRNFTEGKREVVVDYQHASLAPDPEAAKAAGWVKELKKKGSASKRELWAAVQWNEKAVEYIEAGEYRYIS